jgi:hypothetical protein
VHLQPFVTPLFASCLLAACGSNGPSSAFGNGGDGGGANDATTGDGGGSDDGGGADAINLGDTGVADGGGCDAPDMLIVLDHTLSMAAEPSGTRPANTPAGHMLSKWYLATKAIAGVTAPPEDQTVRFGLEVFPLNPHDEPDAGGTGACVTLEQELGGTSANNTHCQPGELVFSPDLGTGTEIATTLDPETFELCISTPIDAAMGTAARVLQAIAAPPRKQFVILVTDGGETCMGDATVTVQALAAAGVSSYIVGFGSADGGAGGVNVKLLNDLACAGGTATGFPAPCAQVEGGTAYVATDPNGPPLFFLAEDGDALATSLQTIAGSVCCGCVK